MNNKTNNKTQAIESIVSEIENLYDASLSKMPRKKIIYEGETKSGDSLVVALPESKIHTSGNGWVDLTKIQIDIFSRFTHAVVVFRLANSKCYFVNMQDLFPLLTQQSVMENNRAGVHWKIDIWRSELTIRNSRSGNYRLPIKANDSSFIGGL